MRRPLLNAVERDRGTAAAPEAAGPEDRTRAPGAAAGTVSVRPLPEEQVKEGPAEWGKGTATPEVLTNWEVHVERIEELSQVRGGRLCPPACGLEDADELGHGLFTTEVEVRAERPPAEVVVVQP